MNRQPIKRIAVGIDFSEHSRAALDHASQIARREGAEIVLVYSEESPRAPRLDEQGEPATNLDQTLLNDVKERRDQLARLADEACSEGRRVSHALVDDSPVPGVAFAAKELGADLVIVGSRGNTGIKRLLLGSVAERTLRLADSHAMVARGEAPRNGYDRVLVPTDFSPAAERALQLGLQLAANGGAVELFHCVIPTPMVTAMTPEHALSRPMADVVRELAESAVARAEALARRHRTTGVRLHPTISKTVPPGGILERLDSERDPIDLAVMGTHGRRGWRRFFLGSHAEAVARHAPCSVIAVHTDDDDA